MMRYGDCADTWDSSHVPSGVFNRWVTICFWGEIVAGLQKKKKIYIYTLSSGEYNAILKHYRHMHVAFSLYISD